MAFFFPDDFGLIKEPRQRAETVSDENGYLYRSTRHTLAPPGYTKQGEGVYLPYGTGRRGAGGGEGVCACCVVRA